MKVLISAYSCAPGSGSEQAVGWEWSAALASAGIDVTVLTTPGGREEIAEERRRLGLDRLEVVHVPVPARLDRVRGQIGVYRRYLGWQSAAYRRARAIVARGDIDLAHHLTWASLHLGSHLWRLPVPFIFGPIGGGQVAPASLRSFHGQWRTEAIRTAVTRWLLPVDPYARWAVSQARLVFVENAETEQQVHRLGATAVQYLSAVGLRQEDLADAPPEHADGPLRLLWIARLRPAKAVQLALHAMAAVPPDIDAELTILGYGPQAAAVPGWIRELGLERRVRFVGRVPYEEVDGWYRQSHAMLFTSLRESFGIQVLEAMARGVPAIALDHQGVGSVVPDGAAVKVPVGAAEATVAGFADGITGLARDRARLGAIQAAALAYAREQTWDRKAKRLIPVYDAIREATPDATAG